METVEILIAGAGIAGMAAAARLAASGHEVALVDPAADASAGSLPDLRTTAFLQPAVATLTAAGAWAGLEAAAAPLRVMRIIDVGGRSRAIRETADFHGTEAGHALFGWNVANQAVRDALARRTEALPGVRWLGGRSVTGFVSRFDRTIVRLDDGTQLAARLVVAADGRDSELRRLADIPARRWAYGQQALVFAVTHSEPHEGVSTEIHRTGGPLTLVPMPDQDGRPCSSIVWMMPGGRARALMALDDQALAAELVSETLGLYGSMQIAGARAVWPIIAQVALRLTAPRLALIAEAAHVLPPIGAQGLNMSLHDVEALAGLLEVHDDPGDEKLLAAFERRLLSRMLARVAGIDLLNRAAQAETQPLRDLRLAGLRAIHRIEPLRRFVVQAGLGA